MEEKVMMRLLMRFEKVVMEEGLNCLSVKSLYDFVEQLHILGGNYKGFVIVRSEEQSGIFYLDTENMEVGENVGPFSFSPKDKFNVEELLKEYKRLNRKKREENDDEEGGGNNSKLN